MGYSLQSNRKTSEGANHPDRDEQFQYIHGEVEEFQRLGQPVISVDTKKKELIGEYKNKGQERERKKEPIKVNMHDFTDPKQGKVIPYGIYDVTSNQGWVNVGINHDTAQLAVESIRIEHRLFCHITENWRGRPLTSREVVVNLIGSTTTKKGLSVKAQLDETKYEIGKKVSDEDLSKVNIEPASFHGEWNYSILPNTP